MKTSFVHSVKQFDKNPSAIMKGKTKCASQAKQTRIDSFMSKTSDCKIKKHHSGRRQTTIESLKGVVIVEDIVRAKELLANKNQDPDILVEELKKLEAKVPGVDLLRSTKLGLIVNRLRRHAHSEVAALAGRVYTAWRSHIEAALSRPQFDVACDASTEAVRRRSRHLLAPGLGLDADDDRVRRLERQLFFASARLVVGRYRSAVRRVAVELRVTEGAVKEELLARTLRDDQLTGRFVDRYK